MAISPRALPGTLLVMSLTLSPGSHSILDSIPTSRQSPTITSCLFLCCGNGCDMRCRSFRHWRHFQWSWVFIHPHYPLSADWPSTFHIPLFYCLHSLCFFLPSALLPSLCWGDDRQSSWSSSFVSMRLVLSQRVKVMLFYKWKTYFIVLKVLHK